MRNRQVLADGLCRGRHRRVRIRVGELRSDLFEVLENLRRGLHTTTSNEQQTRKNEAAEHGATSRELGACGACLGSSLTEIDTHKGATTSSREVMPIDGRAISESSPAPPRSVGPSSVFGHTGEGRDLADDEEYQPVDRLWA